ncbi:MAG: tol-pal system-associated acyl-CoA thioesterase [Alphaproteobacteria bacterium]|nr:MAG: tol-pal system-associated acyl-CoA thioesterase [Alphaproteobacteria bacterium]
MNPCNIFDIRVYYEDTDAGGIVYYANYLKFAERGRTEFLRDHNISNSKMLEEHGIGVVVRHVEMDLRAPAKLDDMLTVETRVTSFKKVSFVMEQKIMKDSLHLATIIVKLACIKIDSGRPVPLPPQLIEVLNNDDSNCKPD